MNDTEPASPRRTDTVDPRRSRERAVKILFQADVRHVTPDVTLQAFLDDATARAMLDEVDDLSEGQELLPPIAYEPGVEVERVPDDPATSRSSAGGRGRGRPRRRDGADRAGVGDAGDPGATSLDGFTCSLVLGVHEHHERIDELISRFARRWQISRMPVVDRTVLRLATYELLRETTSPAVVIDEAVELAKELSTDDSGRYVNGVLDSVRKHLQDTRTVADALGHADDEGAATADTDHDGVATADTDDGAATGDRAVGDDPGAASRQVTDEGE